MFSEHPTTAQPAAFRWRPLGQDPVALVLAAIDPGIAVGTLLLASLHFKGAFDGADLILALLALALTSPGRLRSAPAAAVDLLLDVVIDWLVVVGLLLLVGHATQAVRHFDAPTISSWIVATPLLQFAAHRALPPLLGRLLATRAWCRTAVIAGAGSAGRDLGTRLAASPLQRIRLLGYFDDRADARLPGPINGERLGGLDALVSYVKRHHVDLIYVALPTSPQPRIGRLLEELRDTTASIYVVPDLAPFDLIQARVDMVDALPVLAVCESPFRGIDGVVKRASDLLIATIALLITAPVLLAIAWAVRRSSPGPVIFRQRRLGIDGREIVVYKFRTMTSQDDGPSVPQARRDDPRTTALGAWLRRHSLDELPQFVNVLQGRMSVVGPRPHALAHNDLYRKLIGGYMLRHKVRPGITGLAQVRGLRGPTDTVDKMRARVECDLEYLRHWSLGLDLKILLRTIAVVFASRDPNAV